MITYFEISFSAKMRACICMTAWCSLARRAYVFGDGTITVGKLQSLMKHARYHGKYRMERPRPRIYEKEVISTTDVQLKMNAAFANGEMGELGTKFDTYLDELLSNCTIADVTNFVRISGKRSNNDLSLHMMRRLPDIAGKLKSLESSEWMFMDVSFIIYGLQLCCESDDGYLSILSTMSRILTRIVKRRDVINSQNLSMIIYGLKKSKYDQRESKEMLSCLHRVVERCMQPLTAQAVGNILYGMRGMSSDDEDVQSLIRALTPQIKLCKGHLGAQEVGNALFGLQGMKSTDISVKALLKALSPLVERCKEPLDSQAVGNALYGFQKMRSESIAVQSLLEALTPHLNNCDDLLKASSVSDALYGLQCMTSEKVAVQSLLQALSLQVQRCREPLNSTHVSNALYGLQGMSSDFAEVRSLLRALSHLLKRCGGSLDARGVVFGLYGLQCMNGSCEEVRLLLQALLPRVKDIKGMHGDDNKVLLPPRELSPEGLRVWEPLTAQHVSLGLYGLLGLLDSPEGRHLGLYMIRIFIKFGELDSGITALSGVAASEYVVIMLPILKDHMTDREVEGCEKIICDIKRLCRGPNHVGNSHIVNGKRMKKSENRWLRVNDDLHSVVMETFENSNLRISHNKPLFDLFQCNILIRIPRATGAMTENGLGQNLMINLEIQKSSPDTKYEMLRDQYFRSKGIVVERIPLRNVAMMSKQDKVEWVLHVTAKALLM